MRNFEEIRNAFDVFAAKMGGGKYSVSVVNNHNGKRITISAALARELGIKNEVSFMIDETTGELLISSNFPYKGAMKAKASGKDDQKKIVYSSQVVHSVTQSFGLDFSKRTSMSFGLVGFETDEKTGLPYIAVKMNSSGGGEDEDQTYCEA